MFIVHFISLLLLFFLPTKLLLIDLSNFPIVSSKWNENKEPANFWPFSFISILGSKAYFSSQNMYVKSESLAKNLFFMLFIVIAINGPLHLFISTVFIEHLFSRSQNLYHSPNRFDLDFKLFMLQFMELKFFSLETWRERVIVLNILRENWTTFAAFSLSQQGILLCR